MRLWIQSRRIALHALPAAWGAGAEENPAGGVSRGKSGSGESSRPAAVKEGLRELGYVEGKNIVIEWRQAEGKLDRLAAFADELVRLKVGVILSAGSTATRAARKATTTIPIVMTQDNDPVGSGFIASLARPGGNITGSSTAPGDPRKNGWSCLKEVVPGLARVAVLGTSANPGNAEGLERDGTRRRRAQSADSRFGCDGH